MDGLTHKVLVTGFAPVGGGRADPSFAVARRLQGWRACGGGVVQALELPCAFEAAHASLVQALRRERPDVVWLLGPTAASHGISVEAVPVYLDADGAAGSPAQPAVLPLQAIVKALGAAGVPAREARNAGCLLSIRLFFTLAHHIASEAPALRAGLMHLPCQADAGDRPERRPELSTKAMAHALRIAIETGLSSEAIAPAGPWIRGPSWSDSLRPATLEEFG